nr:hypothetical protein [Tanacetum cinerariifolium]
PRKSFVTLADHLHEAMADSLPTMVDKHIKEQVEKQVPEQQAIVNDIPSQVDASVRSYLSGYILHVHPAQPQITYVPEQQYQLYLSMKDDPQWQQQDIAIWLVLQMKFEKHQVPRTTCRTPIFRPKDQDHPHDDAHPKGEKSAKRQKTSKYETYMKNFLKSDIIWESRKEILVSPCPRETTPLVLSCQRDPEAPALSLINQDLLYLKKRNSGPEKIALSLHKFLAVVFNDDDIKEQTSRWVNKVHDFQLEIKIYRKKVTLTTPTISFPEVEKHEMFSIIYQPVHEIIYKNSKKGKRVMRHLEIHMFCDATLNRVLEGLKSYNNDVRYGYNQRDLTKDEVEYLKLFEKEIEVRLKYRR